MRDTPDEPKNPLLKKVKKIPTYTLTQRIGGRDYFMATYTKLARAQAILKLSVIIASKRGFLREYHVV